MAETLKSESTAAEKIAALGKSSEGQSWLSELEKAKNPWFYVSCGSGWFHHEGSWLTNLEIPFSYIKSYVERLEKGETIERALDEISKQRDEIVAEYKALIKTDEDRESFDGAYNTIRTIYRYAEDHLFWVEHRFHTIWYGKIREIGQLLVDNGMLNQVDDIFMFNRYEIPELLTEVSTGWALGVARRMLDDLADQVRAKAGRAGSMAENTRFHAVYGELEAKYRAARAYVYQVWRDADETLRNGGVLDDDQRTDLRLALYNATWTAEAISTEVSSQSPLRLARVSRG